jgi:polyisoprenoid-binding protein YceI
MRTLAKLLAALPLAALVLGTAHAAPPHKITLTFTPATTKIDWSLGAVLHTAHGTFALAKGSIAFDAETGAADGLLLINASSGVGGEDALTRNMQTKVLESDKFPLITFRPTHVTGHPTFASDETVTVDGIFTLHGTDHPLKLDIKLHPEAGKVIATTNFVIPYVAWGLKDPSTFVFRVAKTVAIDIQATLPATP